MPIVSTTRMGRKFPVGSTVAVRTDEAPIPHLAIIKKVTPNPDNMNIALYSVLWLYRAHDCKAAPKQLLCSPCSVLRVMPGEGALKKVVDAGDLKEIFFSCHSGDVPHSTILHEVQVMFLPPGELDSEALQRLRLRPGFICRSLVDTQEWTFHPLRPSLLEDATDRVMLKTLLKASEPELQQLRRRQSSDS